MWIRSQHDRLLIDADKIYVDNMGDEYPIYNIGESCNYFLGKYSSLEKAIRVLDAIHGHLNEFDLEGTVVYQMPSDEMVSLWHTTREQTREDEELNVHSIESEIYRRIQESENEKEEICYD